MNDGGDRRHLGYGLRRGPVGVFVPTFLGRPTVFRIPRPPADHELKVTYAEVVEGDKMWAEARAAFVKVTAISHKGESVVAFHDAENHVCNLHKPSDDVAYVVRETGN